jgi:hypothetical protein
MPSTRDTDKIVSDILSEYGIRSSKRTGFDQVIEAEIRGWIKALRDKQGDPSFGYWSDNERWARRLQKWVKDGEDLFIQMPKSFRLLLFLGEWKELFDDTDQRVVGRSRRILKLLGWFARRCDFILKTEAGASGHEKLQKRRAAMAARFFAERCGIPLAYSSDNKPYRGAASLFYEAMTGVYGEDLRYQCEEVAKMQNWQEWREKFDSLRVLSRGRIDDRKDLPEEDRYIDGTSPSAGDA